jgi:hypothetical protein
MGRKTEGNRKIFSLILDIAGAAVVASKCVFTWVDEVSRSPTYLAASKPDHNAGGANFAHRLRRTRLDRVNADAIFARWFGLGFTGA